MSADSGLEQSLKEFCFAAAAAADEKSRNEALSSVTMKRAKFMFELSK